MHLQARHVARSHQVRHRATQATVQALSGGIGTELNLGNEIVTYLSIIASLHGSTTLSFVAHSHQGGHWVRQLGSSVGILYRIDRGRCWAGIHWKMIPVLVLPFKASVLLGYNGGNLWCRHRCWYARYFTIPCFTKPSTCSSPFDGWLLLRFPAIFAFRHRKVLSRADVDDVLIADNRKVVRHFKKWEYQHEEWERRAWGIWNEKEWWARANDEWASGMWHWLDKQFQDKPEFGETVVIQRIDDAVHTARISIQQPRFHDLHLRNSFKNLVCRS